MRMLAATIAVMVVACGDGGTSGGPDAPLALDAAAVDADPCVPGLRQCDNCLDDDDDGRRDGDDNECTGPYDDDEGSFRTIFFDDDLQPVLECFFDDTTGAGDDQCFRHVCCALGYTDPADCPISAQTFQPEECDDPQRAACLAFCEPLTPPTCDCFGCCTICDDAGGACRDIMIRPAVAPNCDASTYADTAACPACVKTADCVGP